MKDSSNYNNLSSIETEVNTRWYAITSKAYGSNNQSNPFGDFSQYFGGNNPFANGSGSQNDNPTGSNDPEEQNAK